MVSPSPGSTVRDGSSVCSMESDAPYPPSTTPHSIGSPPVPPKTRQSSNGPLMQSVPVVPPTLDARRRRSSSDGGHVDALLSDLDGQVDDALRNIAAVSMRTDISDAPMTALSNLIREIRAARKAGMAKQVGDLQRRLAEKERVHATELEEAGEQHAKQLRQARDAHEEKVGDLEDDNAQLAKKVKTLISENERLQTEGHQDRGVLQRKAKQAAEECERQAEEFAGEKLRHAKQIRALHDEKEAALDEHDRARVAAERQLKQEMGQLRGQLEDLQDDKLQATKKIKAMADEREEAVEELQRQNANLTRQLEHVKDACQRQAEEFEEERSQHAKKVKGLNNEKERELEVLQGELAEVSQRLSKKLRTVSEERDRQLADIETEHERETSELAKRLRRWGEEVGRRLGHMSAVFPDRLRAASTTAESSPPPRVLRTVRFDDEEGIEPGLESAFEACEESMLTTCLDMLREASAKCDKVQMEREALRRELGETKQTLADEEDRRRSTEGELRALTNERHLDEAFNARNKAKIDELERQLSAARAEDSVLSAKAAQLDASNKRLKDTCAAHEDETERLQSELRAVQQKYVAAQKRAEEEKERLQDDIRALQQRQVAAQQRANEENERLQDENRALQQRDTVARKRAEDEREGLLHDLQVLEARMAEKTRELQSVQEVSEADAVANEQRLNSASRRMEELERDAYSEQGRRAAAEADVVVKQKELDGAARTIRELEDMAAARECELGVLRDAAEADAAASQTLLADAKMKIEELEDAAVTNAREKGRLLESAEAKQQQLDNAAKQIEEMERNAASSAREVRDLRDAAETNRQELNSAATRIKELEDAATAQNNAQTERLKGLHSQLMAAQAELEEKEDELKRGSAEQRALQQQTEAMASSDAAGRRKVAKLEAHIEELEADVASRDEEIAAQQRKSAALEHTVATADAAVAEANREGEQLAEQLRAAEGERQACEDGRRRLCDDLSAKEREIADQQQHIAELESQLAEAGSLAKAEKKRVRFLEDEREQDGARVRELERDLAAQMAEATEKARVCAEQEQQLDAVERRLTEYEAELKARDEDTRLERLQRLCDKQKKELELLRQQLRQVYESANLERTMLSIQLQQDQNRVVIENQQQHCQKVLQRHWRRVQMPFGKEGSLGIKIKGPAKGDVESPVVVADLSPHTASHKAGLRPDCVITRVTNPVGSWSIVTRSDFLKSIGPQGHVFEGVEIVIEYVSDKKWVDDWRKKLNEHYNSKRSQQNWGSVMQKIGDDKPHLKTAFGAFGAKKKSLVCSPPRSLVKEIRVRVAPLSDDAKRNRLKHANDMGTKNFGADFNAENVHAMQSHPEMWRSLVFRACEECGTATREMIPGEEGVGVVERLATYLGCPSPPRQAALDALTLMADDATGINFTELTLVSREIYMDVVFRDALGGAPQETTMSQTPTAQLKSTPSARQLLV